MNTFSPQPFQQPQFQQQQYQMPQYQPYNPNIQNRLFHLEQNNPQFGQTLQPVQNNQAAAPQPVQARAITSVDEAKAHPVSFDNTLFVFVEPASGKMYTKQWDMATGGATFYEYQRIQPEQPKPQPEAPQNDPQQLSFDDPKETLDEKYDALQAKYDGLMARLSELEERLNATTTATDGDAEQPASTKSGGNAAKRRKSNADAGTDGE